MKKLVGIILLFSLVMPFNAHAHHGGVSLALGPGSPIETNSPLTLPEGGFVVSTRYEHVDWQRFSFADPENKTVFNFANVGLTYGFTSYLMGSIFVPIFVKEQQDGHNEGLADIRFQATLGFNYDPESGLHLNGAGDDAVTLEGSHRTYFGVWAGATAPTGRSHMEITGTIDRTMQPGFGSPSFTVGTSATRMLGKYLTLVGEISYDVFTESEDFQFGNEFRTNLAGVVELYGKPNAFMSKLDGIMELNFLNIARDQSFGEGEVASGGNTLYITPGLRFSFPKLHNANLGIGVKVPVWRSLNEQSEQQGSEGLEKYRLITTLSFYF